MKLGVPLFRRLPWVCLALSLASSVSAQSTPASAVRHNPRDGFLVADEDTRRGYIRNATIWRPFDLEGVDLSQGQSLGSNKGGLPKTLPNDKVIVCDFKSHALGGTTPKFECDHITGPCDSA